MGLACMEQRKLFCWAARVCLPVHLMRACCGFIKCCEFFSAICRTQVIQDPVRGITVAEVSSAVLRCCVALLWSSAAWLQHQGACLSTCKPHIIHPALPAGHGAAGGGGA